MRFHLFRRLSCRAPCVFPEDEPDLAAFPPDAKLAFADSPTLEDADVRPVHPVEALTHTLGLDPTYAEFQAHLLLLSGRIARLDSLAPSPATNAAFGELVALVTFPFHGTASLSAALFADTTLRPTLATLLTAASRAEAEMEVYYSRLIVASSSSTPSPLALFPYAASCRSLVRLELALLAALGAAPLSAVAFLGSSALPLSALLLAQSLPSSGHVLNVDNDATALAQGERLALALGIACLAGPSRLAFLRADAAQLGATLLGGQDAVWLAAPVGPMAGDKMDVVRSVVDGMRVGAWLVVRSAVGLRRVVCAEVEVEAVVRACEGKVRLAVEAHPSNEVINSVLVFQRI